MTAKIIQTYVINLKSRCDRRKFILSQFNEKFEFNTHLIDACQHNIGSIGLWNTIQRILRDLAEDKDEFIVLCEDDHKFTSNYSKEYLLASIEKAKTKNADILSGGISGFTSAIQVSDNLYWVEKFSGLQFTVIFRKFFQTILNAEFRPGDAADYKLCSLTDNKFFIYPFISIQKDFGYSDATPKNNKEGRVEELFKQSEVKIQMLKRVSGFYKDRAIAENQKANIAPVENIEISTYIINLPERTERRRHALQQFKGKSEFAIKTIEACRHKIGNVGLWLSIRKIIEIAIENDEEVIIICEDDHEFTNHYNRDILIKNIFHAYSLGCNILSGGIGGFNLAMPVTETLHWIDSFWCTQFIVIYRNFFEDILREPFSEADTVDGKFSEMTSQKMVLYPFISVQKDFGYSDVTSRNHEIRGLVETLFIQSSRRLESIRKIHQQHLSKV